MRYRPLSHTRHVVGWKVILLSLLAGAVVAGGLYFLASKRAIRKMERRGLFSQTVTLVPGGSHDYLYFFKERGVYQFVVSPLDGPVIIVVEKVDEVDSDELGSEAFEAAVKEGFQVEPGTTRDAAGRATRGRYMWAVVNPSQDKPVTVTINFRAHDQGESP